MEVRDRLLVTDERQRVATPPREMLPGQQLDARFCSELQAQDTSA